MAAVAHVYRRDLRAARFELRASIQAGELLAHQLDEMAGFARLMESTNYRLAIELHGKRAVDRAIESARERGTN
jgi:hypothetical protein